jgi:hypothetical protein
MWARALQTQSASTGGGTVGFIVLAVVAGFFVYLWWSNQSSGPSRRLSDGEVAEQADRALEFFARNTSADPFEPVDLAGFFSAQRYANSQLDIDAVLHYLHEAQGWIRPAGNGDTNNDNKTLFRLSGKGHAQLQQLYLQWRQPAPAPGEPQGADETP